MAEGQLPLTAGALPVAPPTAADREWVEDRVNAGLTYRALLALIATTDPAGQARRRGAVLEWVQTLIYLDTEADDHDTRDA